MLWAAGINRVILATDGDFNVGMVNQGALIQLIEQERAKGISLTTLVTPGNAASLGRLAGWPSLSPPSPDCCWLWAWPGGWWSCRQK
ncbi:MAG: hypothetical protein IPN92_04840 [Chromatiaceae bacterium]|nr:hypothetical protein [Chromatiaceae bacterium]